ncbi:V-type ATP synthase subunit F [Streptococcus hillyeri]|uniref:V-type ATP synthase subunit F n=1 Tax=Streptococcus hillyeri TaxID=2282420 RepID=A0A3L9DSU0_9STRE|nr:V-type ATP synthase subunit F [Streptococcus hillyeri]RLY02679.1 V-type ATP synthase subunit F [Streptococcus hillyeri]
MTYKIAVVGDKDSILPFKMIGFEIFDAKTSQVARQTIDQLAQDDYGIIYVTESLAQEIPETLERYRSQAVPAVILIPNYKGSLGLGMQNIQDNVEKAIGQNIL